MTAAVNVTGQPAGPKYSMAGAPWRKEKMTEGKSPGPGAVSLVLRDLRPFPGIAMVAVYTQLVRAVLPIDSCVLLVTI